MYGFEKAYVIITELLVKTLYLPNKLERHEIMEVVGMQKAMLSECIDTPVLARRNLGSSVHLVQNFFLCALCVQVLHM